MGRPRRRREEQHSEASPPPRSNYYTSSNDDNGVALSSTHNAAFTAFAQEKQQSQIYITTDIPMDTSTSRSASISTSTNTSTTFYDHDPPIATSIDGKPCVYGDPAMIVPNIRYNHVLLPLNILLPKTTAP
ncbi:MAG: hypothetical protein M1839_007453 [Geoglossum umbratile]|nr:MAG: hypothetical protein M1839_007453 [Geoglossum umbratile]